MIENRSGTVACGQIERRMNETMNDCLGIRRREETLAGGAAALAELRALCASGRDVSFGAAEQYLLERRLALAQAMVESARARRESRGAQYRADYPERNDGAFRKTTLARYRDGETEITFADLPKEGAP